MEDFSENYYCDNCDCVETNNGSPFKVTWDSKHVCDDCWSEYNHKHECTLCKEWSDVVNEDGVCESCYTNDDYEK